MINYDVYIYRQKDNISDTGQTVFPIHRPSFHKECVIYNAVMVKEVNAAGSFTFDMPAANPNAGYDMIRKEIVVSKNGKHVFVGRIDSRDISFDGSVHVEASGALAMLSDFIVFPYIFKYNKNNGAQKAFSVNMPFAIAQAAVFYERNETGSKGWVKANNGWRSYIGDFFRMASILSKEVRFSGYTYDLPPRLAASADKSNTRASSSFPDALTEFMDKVIGCEGGYVTCEADREYSDGRVDVLLDYTDGKYPGKICNQTIEFGKNMLDLSRYCDMTQVVKKVVPLGARIEDTTFDGDAGRVMLTDPDDIDLSDGQYLMYTRGIVENAYPDIKTEKAVVKIWDNVTTHKALFEHAVNFLKTEAKKTLRFEISAFDLSIINVDYDEIEAGDMVHVVSEPHGVDAMVMCRKVTYDLLNPENNKYEFGQDTGKTASELMAKR